MWNPFYPPDFRKDAGWLDESKWADGVAGTDPDRDRLALDHARARYTETVARATLLDNKIGEMGRTAAGLLTIVVAASVALRAAPEWPVIFACACWLVALLISVVVRRAVYKPTAPTVRQVMEGWKGETEPVSWLAAALHKSDEAWVPVANWYARSIDIGNCLIVAGVLLLLVALGRL